MDPNTALGVIRQASAHGRAHVRRGEAVELYKFYAGQSAGRLFLAPGEPRIEKWLARGFEIVAS